MSTDEEKYKEELKASGVEVPEEPKVEEPKEAEPKEPAKEPEEPKAPLQEKKPEEQRKRSIYDEYKDKKAELKSETERREQAEKERDELAQKLEQATAAKGTENADDTAEDAIAYAKKIGADPDLVQRIIRDAQKGVKPETDDSLKKDIAEFKTWKSQNQQMLEKQMFDDEFQRTLPAIKESFPNVSDEEVAAIKKELDAISHTKEWHDKDLDYVAFKNKDKLSALVSPKKRGMETKGRKDVDVTSFEFDPNADYSKMSAKEREAWEEKYKELMKSEGLVTDANGKRLLI